MLKADDRPVKPVRSVYELPVPTRTALGRTIPVSQTAQCQIVCVVTPFDAGNLVSNCPAGGEEPIYAHGQTQCGKGLRAISVTSTSRSLTTPKNPFLDRPT